MGGANAFSFPNHHILTFVQNPSPVRMWRPGGPQTSYSDFRGFPLKHPVYLFLLTLYVTSERLKVWPERVNILRSTKKGGFGRIILHVYSIYICILSKPVRRRENSSCRCSWQQPTLKTQTNKQQKLLVCTQQQCTILETLLFHDAAKLYL